MAAAVPDTVPFATPVVRVNAAGWGPTADNVPTALLNVPFAPFGKGDRLGRAADFTSNAYSTRYQRNRDRHGLDGTQNADFQYKHDASEEQTFNLVDTSKTPSNNRGGFRARRWGGRGGRGGGRWGDRGGRNGRKDQEPQSGRGPGRNEPQRRRNDPRFNDRRFGGRGGRGGRGRFNRDREDRQASVKVAADWTVVEEFDLAQCSKLQTRTPEVEDLQWTGHLDGFDDKYDRVASKNPKPLRRFENKAFYSESTMDDPVIEKFVVENPPAAAEGQVLVYATDLILSHLMACPRSVYGWDIVVQKLDGTIFFDKRDASQFDYLTVSETAFEPPTASEDPDAINTPNKLSLEASAINQNFTQQILKPELREEMEMPNPFFDEEETPHMEPASVAYRYRRFTLGNIQVVARCEIHGTVQKRGTKQYMTAFALNEWDSKMSGGIEWRQKIDVQRGAVLATELKNNAFKLAKWTAQSIVAGADQMNIGFVSRKNRKDPHNHVVLATQFYKPHDFAKQIMSETNMWGIIKMLVDQFMRLDDGKYVLMKDPNKPILRIFSVPPETFEDEEEAEEEEEEGEEGGAEEAKA